MAFVFISLSIILCVITLKVWRNQNFLGLKTNLVALTLGFIAFNAILGLLLLFDGLESNSDNLILEFTQYPGTLSLLILCVANGFFYTLITILFLTRSAQSNKKT